MSEPYHRASKAIREGEESAVNLIQNAAMTYAGGKAITAGYSTLNKIMPAVGAFLSNYVPENLAIKGLSKIDPRLGDFMQGALNEGYGFDDVKGFIGEKVAKTQEEEKKNIIKQYDPELHEYISTNLKKGKKLADIGQKALSHGRFARIIKDLTRDHKTSWSSILQSVFGSGEEPISGEPAQEDQNPMAPAIQQQMAPEQPPSAARQRLNAARQMGKQALGNS